MCYYTNEMDNKNIYIINKTMIHLFLFFHLVYTTYSSCAQYTSNCDPRCSGSCYQINSDNDCCACVASYNGQDLYYWVQEAGPGKKCAAYCPGGYYENTGTDQCTICADECLTCSGGTKYTCESCTADSYK